jgi:predicted TIM-barrel fold metal-dependent hydrolase
MNKPGNKKLTIDIHVHALVPETQILAEMDEAGVNRSVLLFVDTDPLDVEKPEIKEKMRSYFKSSSSFFHPILWSFQPIEQIIKGFFLATVEYYPHMKSSNLDIAELVKKHPSRFIGFGSVNPNKDEEYVEEKLKEISKLDLKGIKMLPTLQFFNPAENKNFGAICEYCEKNRKVLLYHTGCDPGPWEIPELSEDANPKYLKPVLERYKPKIIIAHTGCYSAVRPGLWLDEALDLGKEFDNVYFDSSAASHMIYTGKVIERIRESVGLDRLLYGSDYPVVMGSEMQYEVNVIKKCQQLTDEEKDKILGLNAAKLLGLST